MVSSLFSGKRGTSSGKKCSLLMQLVFNRKDIDASIYTSQVRSNLMWYVRQASKVKAKVGHSALTISDRTLRHNKLERIPISLIVRAQIDDACPLLCYFISEAIRNQFRVTTFLCKSSRDSHSLVKTFYQRRNRLQNWYRSFHNEGSISTESTAEDNPYITQLHPRAPYWSHQIMRHSTEGACLSHDNYVSEELQPNDLLCGRAGHSYGSDVARVIVRGDNRPPKLRKNKGLRIVDGFQNSQQADKSRLMSLQMMNNTRIPVKYHGNTSKHKVPGHHVEESFIFVPAVQNRRQVNPSHRRPYLADYTNSGALGLVRFGHFGKQNQRRKGQYSSIQEYEEAVRTGTMSSSGLRPTSGSENINPRIVEVPPDNYTLRQSNKLQGRSIHLPDNQTRNYEPIEWEIKPTSHQSRSPNFGLQMVDGGTFQNCGWKRTSRSAPAATKHRHQLQKDTYSRPSQLDIQPQQLSNELQIQPAASPGLVQGNPMYKVKTQGKGDNYLKHEALIHDDDHKYYRQHGQRVKKTQDGGQQLFLDNRLAETKDVIGNQLVQGRHSQKVHSGESVGANHRSKFHSEVMVSHKTSQPATSQLQTTGNTQNIPPFPTTVMGRKNSRPVRVTTHPWPPGVNFDSPDMSKRQFNSPGHMNFNFHNNFAAFPSDEPLQRFFKPHYSPHSPFNFNPGFQRFFESINDFGPQTQHAMMIEDNPISDNKTQFADTNTASVRIPTNQNSGSSPKVEHPSDNESETSSIRSSASAYWPPELKFGSVPGRENSWKFHNNIKLRGPVGTSVHQHQRRLL